MDKKEVISSVLMICLTVQLLGSLVGQSAGQSPAPACEPSPSLGGFPQCYAACVASCLLNGGNIKTCGLTYLAQCMPLQNSTFGAPSLQDTPTYCTLGCATIFCSNISTEGNIAEYEVGECVDSCSGTCAKKY